jgi:hypothetical protein
MEKEFVPYNLSLRMKQLGFDETCCGYYDHSIKELDTISSEVCERLCKHDTHIKAPLYQQAFRWFREKYDLNGFVGYLPNAKKWYSSYLDIKWSGREYMKVMETEDRGIRFETYEEAELACIEKLIEIVEEKQKEI